ncbi:MAG TPA: response regulator [Chromatiaceae bacterium]|jgi:two-component system cell cycle response regulator CpdR|nr:response regulator [Alphaproteobacteria bacterium]HBG94101.1 response regulator [Chromatiaceae bacterium]HBH26755.1 response regulator [Rhodospirillaceae bacterium]
MAHILVAEDDASMRQFLSAALARAGHSVVVAEDGLAALAALEADARFDLLLADIVMPGMDGIALSQKAQALVPGLKVMFITGFSGMAVEAHARAQPVPVVAKPFHLRDLVGHVERLLAA